MRRWLANLVLLSLATLVSGCQLIEQHILKPTVSFKQTTFQHISVQEGILKSRIQLTNPNNFGLPVNSITYHLLLNQQKFAHSQISLKRNIPANDSIEFELPVTIRYQQLLGGVVAALQSNNMTFKLSGEVDFGLVTIPYQKTGNFALR